MPKKIDKDIKEIINTISRVVGCGIQYNGSPCNTCFHAWASDVGLSDDMAHLFWLVLLGIRGDYPEEEIIEGIEEMNLFKPKKVRKIKTKK